jgi:NAD(P)-dependent dehydrogenase (short-subunit alcohol dehydrogenase family)
MDNRPDLQPAAPQGSVLISGVGASQGLGAAISRRFAAGGYPVAIAGRNSEKLAATAAELAAAGAKVTHVVGDASNAADVVRFVEAAEKLAPLAVAVHNAGSNRPAPFLKLSEEQFEAHWREHALGGFQLAQAAIPALLARGGGGSLIFTGASGSLRGKANFAPFAAAKAALRALAQSVAREFGPQGIHVGHVVVDGGIEGERLLSVRPQLKEARGPDGMLNIAAIADAYWVLHHQHRSAWTLELDLRPWSESF